MLIELDPTLLAKPEWNSLKTFLRQPFSDDSCRRIDDQLPMLAPAYRAMAATRTAWAGALPALKIDDMTDVFLQAKALGTQPLPLVPPSLLKAQVVLLDEMLRDDAAWVRKRAGDAGPFPHLDVDTTHLALRAFALHEAAFLALAGIFEVRHTGAAIEFSFTPHGCRCLLNRVLTTRMQEDTELSMRQQLHGLIAGLRRGDRTGTSSIARLLDASVLDDVQERFLDAFFSIGAHMRRSPDVQPLIDGARKLCRWFALLECVRLAGEISCFPDRDLVERLGLDQGLLDHVLAERAASLPSDRGIHRGASGDLSLGTGGLAHAIHCCKSAVLSSKQARALGEKFEEEITAYVRTAVPPADYVVRGQVKRSENGGGRMYDCDLILFEAGRRKIFFVQAKWKRDSRTANLDDELHDWGADNWPLTKGVDRLTALRERLAEPTVLEQVRTALGDIKMSADEILANSHYIVVHTLPYFSAYEIDGVVIYEWNLFRNLLLRGAVQRTWSPDGMPGRAVPLATHVHPSLLPLEDPQRILDHYCAAIGADPAVLPAALEARQQARYGFELALPRASWWKRPGRMSILRPYI